MRAIKTDITLSIVITQEFQDRHDVVNLHPELDGLQQEFKVSYVGNFGHIRFHVHKELEHLFDVVIHFIVVMLRLGSCATRLKDNWEERFNLRHVV
jgi:hypothetical protein